MTDGLTRRSLFGFAVALAPLAARAEPFTGSTVRRQAQDLAKQPYRPPDTRMPAAASSMTYDQYRGIQFKQDRALWRGQDLPFQVGFFPRGFLYRSGVDIYEVRDGQSAPVPYNADMFDYADPSVRVPDPLGFAGFRVHAPINKPGDFDEFCVFLGASYFRAVGRGGFYGLSARGLAIGTGRAEPEEFPRFRAFWLERPQPGVSSLVIHALLDSPSTTGAYRFTVRPGVTTVMDVESVVFPRADIPDAGVAPLTSMYQFSPRDHRRGSGGFIDDWRPAVHDSDGLSMLTGRNERLWRLLVNPAAVAVSAFQDTNPRGFGLLQRRRSFTEFQDLQVLYGARPSLWVEPIGDWGQGAVHLVEIPTPDETNDNIVAAWRPREPLRARGEYGFTYRMHWGADDPLDRKLARVAEMHTGKGDAPGSRVFVLDLAGDALKPDAKLRAEVGSSAGRLVAGFVGPNPETGGWRVSLDFAPEGAAQAELRCVLVGDQGPVSETWLYRWAA